MTDLMPDLGSRLTRPFYRAERSQSSVNRFVFTRDAHLGLVPIGGRSERRPEFDVRIRGDAAREDEVIRLVSRQRDYTVAEAVCGFVEEVAQVLVGYGKAAYEVITDEVVTPASEEGEKTTETPQHRRLVLVPPLSLHSLARVKFQMIPREARADGPALIKVPRDRIWEVSLPRALGTPWGHRRMLRELDRLDKRSHRFMTLSPPKGYDFSYAQRAINAAVVRKTRRWGLLFHYGSSDQMTGYFTVAGHIYHRRAQAVLRNHIEAWLNGLLTDLELPDVEIRGLPSVHEIDRVLSDLEAGRIDLKQASELTST